jgi:hypothetical protein
MSKLQYLTSQGVNIIVELPARRDRLTYIEAEEILTWLKSILEPPKPLLAPQPEKPGREIQTVYLNIKTETKEFGTVRIGPTKTYTLTEYWKIKDAERARNAEQREKTPTEQLAKKRSHPGTDLG